MIKSFRHYLFLSCALFLCSSLFTGIKYQPIIKEGVKIERGYYESFLFLIISTIILAIVYALLYRVKEDLLNKLMRKGMFISKVSMIFFGLSLLFCDGYAIFNNWRWGESTIIWFYSAVLATILFIIGLLSFTIGFFKKEEHL